MREARKNCRKERNWGGRSNWRNERYLGEIRNCRKKRDLGREKEMKEREGLEGGEREMELVRDKLGREKLRMEKEWEEIIINLTNFHSSELLPFFLSIQYRT
jgi:hypothetical protein